VSVYPKESPFRKVTYEATLRGGAAVTTVVRELPCYQGERQALEVLEQGKALAFFEGLLKDGVFDIKMPQDAKDGAFDPEETAHNETVYEFWVAKGKEMKRFYLGEQALFKDHALLGQYVGLMRAVLAHVAPPKVRALFCEFKKIGYLSVTSNEDAIVLIDGWDRMETPVDAVELEEGEHTIKVIGKSGQVREFTVRIGQGLTARYHVVFE
jgi:hypothetical protein